MQTLALSEDGRRLLHGLQVSSKKQAADSKDLIHISGVGGNLYFAYEQLRNAAEYSERHLLLRRAVERFLRRNINFRTQVRPLGQELISDLTHARYLSNDSVPRSSIRDIETIIDRYLKLAGAVRTAHSVSADQLHSWIFQSASVEIEHQLVDYDMTDAYIDFVYHHYLDHIDRSSFEDMDDHTYRTALYYAVHRTLFKSDVATIRYYALAARLGPRGANSLDYFVGLNTAIDTLQYDPLTNKISRLVNRYGAPLRILREVLIGANDPVAILEDQAGLSGRVGHESQNQYKLMRKRLNDGIIRSIIFIFITKVLLGLSLEVPFDLISFGEIMWVPLVINTLFPPLYMATIGLSVRIPGKRNTEVIQSYVNRTMYQTDDPPLQYRIRRRVSSSTLNAVFNVLYIVGFLISFGILVYILKSIGFNLMNGAIFFVFLSVVSFFGFRLLQTSRELEIVDTQKSILSVLLDFFYMPFIRVGNFLSDRYSRLNIVTFILDLAIELPLKTSLRVTQQWVGFLRDKQEEL